MIKENHSLKNYNTFGIDVKTKFLIGIKSETQLLKVLKSNKNKPFRVIGGGSNILLTKNYLGLTLIMENKGIGILKETKKKVLLEVQAGENWHDLVNWSLERNLGGIENLALIPGSVGAAPIQNIGAYGVELESVFQSCRALKIDGLNFKDYYKDDCQFSYRSSIFKTKLKDKVIITSVRLKLQKIPHKIKIHYSSLNIFLKGKTPSIQNVASAVIEIRKSKLPDPNEIGNSGSFFKNPLIHKEQFKKLQKKHPKLPHFEEENEFVKIPAAWLIEKLGYKGKRYGDAGVHKKQALVLVNYGSARGVDILNLAQEIQVQVTKHFNIKLEIEVNLF